MSQCGKVIAIATTGLHRAQRLHARFSVSSSSNVTSDVGSLGRIGTTFGGYIPASISAVSRVVKQRFRFVFFANAHTPTHTQACMGASYGDACKADSFQLVIQTRHASHQRGAAVCIAPLPTQKAA